MSARKLQPADTACVLKDVVRNCCKLGRAKSRSRNTFHYFDAGMIMAPPRPAAKILRLVRDERGRFGRKQTLQPVAHGVRGIASSIPMLVAFKTRFVSTTRRNNEGSKAERRLRVGGSRGRLDSERDHAPRRSVSIRRLHFVSP